MKDLRRKKICFIGASAVGKTSLVAACSGQALCSEYQSTLGVAVSTLAIPIQERLREIVVWDIKGESEFYRIPHAYLHGMDGYVIVADGTRASTLTHALILRTRMEEIAGNTPHLLLINKLDLSDLWEIDPSRLSSAHRQVRNVHTCSARSGLSVRSAIEKLSREMWGLK